MTPSVPSHPRLPWWELALGTLLCMVVPYINGYPLIFGDTAAYLVSANEMVVLHDRPIFYGLFLRLFIPFGSLWVPALAQAAMGAFLVLLLLSRMGLGRSGSRLTVLAVLVVTTGLSRFAGQLVADVFLSYLVVSFYLLACHGSSLAKGERAVLVGIFMVSVMVHNSHLAIALGLLVSVGLIAWGLRRRGCRGLLHLGVPALALGAVLVLWPTMYKLLTGAAYFSRAGHIFITARLIKEGIIQELLARRCGVEHYVLCDHQEELRGMHSDTFLFEGPPAFHAVGGYAKSEESMRMVKDSVRYLPWLHLKKAVRNVGRQLDSYDLGDGLGAYSRSNRILQIIPEQYPREVFAFEHSLQQMNRLEEFFKQHRPLNRTLGMLSLVLLPVLAVLAYRRRLDGRTVLLAVMVALTLLGNAMVTALLSGVYHRYQARVMWLPVLACIVMAYQLWGARRAARGGGEVPAPVSLPPANEAPARASVAS
ncbi:hypothetical protein [Myxococcus sp. RHSTA-1-4]|uniref:hypothetical protein n=1 Tax=Myxococcus sp. RHSTA-1-4 TaxID=2874601 RepID=UPI001CBFCD74|nr:hypothetical protein [Myxococcus sp. RHSTA-1-4]MBZ4421559.1 hypothetical protein [Myxococcus sp. RHSTA-1-4]